MINKYFDYDELEKIASEKDKYKVVCRCGTKTVLIKADKTICRNCGHWVYRTKEIEFKEKLKEKLHERR